MVIAKIMGGLGNQMFQYAYGLALSRRTGQALCLDTTVYASGPVHSGFELKRLFNVPEECVGADFVDGVLGWRRQPWAQAVLRRLPVRLDSATLAYVPEYGLRYQHIPSVASKYVYLNGYWQSQWYFEAIADEVRCRFSFPPLSSGATAISEAIASVSASVSVHVRRGDYVSNARAAAHHGTCPPEYYKAAIGVLRERLRPERYFVFSDDAQWARDNLGLDGPTTFVEGNSGSASYVDMQLMSQCKHHIIANSSFSWWAAWLDGRAEKVVVAPKRWVADKTSAQHTVPESWLRV